MTSADRMLNACPRCHAWPMAATGSREWPETEMLFKCPRCGTQASLLSLSRSEGGAERRTEPQGA
jgi:hypothetical protein